MTYIQFTLFLKALPMKKGTNFRATVALRIASYSRNNIYEMST